VTTRVVGEDGGPLPSLKFQVAKDAVDGRAWEGRPQNRGSIGTLRLVYVGYASLSRIGSEFGMKRMLGPSCLV
jgi:hypothetical protein